MAIYRFRGGEYGLKEKNITMPSASFRSPDKGQYIKFTRIQEQMTTIHFSTTEQTLWSTKKRGMTPRKIYFMSDYLQGYDPLGATETKASSTTNTNNALAESKSFGSDTERLYKRNQIEPHGLASKYNRNEGQKLMEEALPVSSRTDTVNDERKVPPADEKTEINDLNSYSRIRGSRAGSFDKVQPVKEP